MRERLGCSEQTVLNWRRDYLARREEEKGPLKRCGIVRVKDDRRFFPPEQVVQAKAIACERPEERGEPLGRYSLADTVLIMKREGIVSQISRSTLSRWYQADALRPWRYRQWLFPRDPLFNVL